MESGMITTDSGAKVGQWMQTYTGKAFYPLAPRAEDVDIQDIAHALSNLCRFAGHVKKFYSVAEHCVRVSYACDPVDAFQGLMHDAPEAYVIDLPSPIKHSGHFEGYRDFEQRVYEAIAERYGLHPTESKPHSVEIADKVLLITEQRDLMGKQVQPWKDVATPLETRILPLAPEQAKMEFLIRFNELYKGRIQ